MGNAAIDQTFSRPLSAATRKLQMLRTLVCGNKYERSARSAGALRIAGVDEVGRGALFGPVVAAAVILPEDCRIRGLRDSKQLEPEDRERLARVVEKKAIAFTIEEVDAETIDRINIYQASKLAMLAAVRRLAPEPDHLLIDALRLDHPCAQTSIIYGDSLSISIAAASVIAKVYRDRRMCEYHEQYPQYGLASHKGYSTPEHKRALALHGPTPLHRFTFRPVAQRSLPWDYPLREISSERIDEIYTSTLEDDVFETLSDTLLTPFAAELPDELHAPLNLSEETRFAPAPALHHRPS
jgi:ribonuclease HII